TAESTDFLGSALRRSITSCPASTSTRATTSGMSLSSRKRTQLLRRLSQLPRDQQIDFATVIFVIGEALVNLRASNIGKTVRDRIDCFAVLQKADHVVNTDACSFDPRVTAANSLCLHDVAIVRRRFHLAGLYHSSLQDRYPNTDTNCTNSHESREIARVIRVRPLLRHDP